jgi:hypothetical protein
MRQGGGGKRPRRGSHTLSRTDDGDADSERHGGHQPDDDTQYCATYYAESIARWLRAGARCATGPHCSPAAGGALEIQFANTNSREGGAEF